MQKTKLLDNLGPQQAWRLGATVCVAENICFNAVHITIVNTI
jgi:hypothetical protein